MPDASPSGLRAVVPTERPVPRITHICAKCGVPLTPLRAAKNAAKHTCDGDYEWLEA